MDMKTLLVLRHAKSDWGDFSLADHDRPLAKRGKKDAPKMGELIREQSLTPDLILSSTAKRAHHTAELVAEACGYEGEILLSRDMYHAGPEGYIEAINEMAENEEILMIVGHNPGMEQLVDVLTDESVTLTTANLAHIQFSFDSWRKLRELTEGKLLNLWRPKEL
jgi:phosphohistidine phosphatase